MGGSAAAAAEIDAVSDDVSLGLGARERGPTDQQPGRVLRWEAEVGKQLISIENDQIWNTSREKQN